MLDRLGQAGSTYTAGSASWAWTDALSREEEEEEAEREREQLDRGWSLQKHFQCVWILTVWDEADISRQSSGVFS